MNVNPYLAVDQDLCIGAARCVLAAPEVFDQGDDGLVRLTAAGTRATPDAVGWAAVDRALRACPSGAVQRATSEKGR
ncbi:ferredoxin [Kibdelosporangium banguiense]|uniref:Ferredoxin n=1 Tax=Kibdelosporangium banguiense TaxID=1365924 RepID=A0ABS4TW69_9PSEU|nr:ferredoxin [Kibdelosporangium banguiense]MBP2328664.1 ferredoxin [Kibdelosporangium banguiense]